MGLFGSWGRSPRLAWESLPPEDREIARVISEEAEVERKTRLDALPPLSPEMAAKPVTTSLLGPPQTFEESRRSAIEAIPWDELLRGGEAHSRCVSRTGLGYTQLLDFVLSRCSPANWEAMWWYRNWVSEALADRIPKAEAEARLRAKQDEIAKAQRAQIASKGGQAKGEKYAQAKAWTRAQWRKEGAEWDSKARFAAAFVEVVLNEHGIKVSASTISDVWLAPSRLAKQDGETS